MEGFNALVEHSTATLRVNVVARIAWQAGDHFDPMLSEKDGQVFKSRLKEDRQITPVDNVKALSSTFGHESPKIWIQLGSATRDVDSVDGRAGLKKQQNSLRRAQGHAFGSLWTGLDVAMLASLVANLSHVDLNSRDLMLPQNRESILFNNRIKAWDRGNHCLF